jgi:hypothetical protein
MLGRLVVMVYRTTTVAGKKYQEIIKNELCFDIMWRDFVRASSEKKYWDEKNIIFRTQDRDVQFFIKKDKFYRRAGKYDFVSKRWINRSSCVVFDDIFVKNLSISLEYRDDRVAGVFVTWEREKRSISLRNDRTVRLYCTC